MGNLKAGAMTRRFRCVTAFAVTISLILNGATNAQDVPGNDQDESAVVDDGGGTQRIVYADLPEPVRKEARKEFPDQRLMAVEKSEEDGRLTYHVMFEVDGSEAGLRMDPQGTILDRWHFKDGEDEGGEGDAGFLPTLANIKYGPHERNVLDFWRADSKTPTPLLICIHGGGFSGGDKRGFRADGDLIRSMLAAKISVAAINYRLTDGGKHPYPIPMHDGARAIQFLRHHAKKYNLDKGRFAATGGSAGGCMLMWLGFHPDLAKPDHNDLVQRESSRLQVLAPHGGQSCLHLPTLEKWFGVESLEVHPAYWPLFGLDDGPIKLTDRFDAAMRDASPITHLTADDPPIYLSYGDENRPVTAESSPNVWVHHPVMGTKLKVAMDALKLECHVEYPGCEPIVGYSSQADFVIRQLRQLRSRKRKR